MTTKKEDLQQQHLRSNSIKIVLAKLGSKLGDLLANTKTVLPWLLSAAGAPTFFAASLAPIRESGALIPQVLISHFIAKFSYRKWFFCAGSLIQGTAIFSIGAGSVYLEGSRFGWLALLCIAIFSLARALCSLSSKDVIGKVIPKQRRGRLGGISASVSGAISIAAGFAITSGLLQQWGLKDGTTGLRYILFLASTCWLLAAAFFALIKERKNDVEQNADKDKEHEARIKPLQKFKSLLKEKSYRRFLIIRTLMISSSLALPYFIILTQQTNEQKLFSLGLFIILGGLANLSSGWFWGRFSDQSSRRVMIISAGMTSILLFAAVLLLWLNLASSDWMLGALFFILSIIHAGVRLGRKTYILDISNDSNRLDYISVANTSIGIVLLIMGLVTAYIASYSILAILLFFAATSASAALLGKKLPEAT